MYKKLIVKHLLLLRPDIRSTLVADQRRERDDDFLDAPRLPDEDLEEALLEEALLEEDLLEEVFLDAVFLEADFLDAVLFVPAFLEAVLLEEALFVPAFLEAVFFDAVFLDGDFEAVRDDLPAALFLPGEALFLDAPLFLDGTFAPSFLASERPIAIACLREVTFLPLLPLFKVPRFFSCIALSTFSPARLEYLAIMIDLWD